MRATRAAGAAAAKASAGDEPASGGSELAKLSKNQLARLRRDLEMLEDEIVSLEVDLEELEQTLAQSHTLRPEEIEAASRQHGEVKKLLQERYADWGTRSEELERQKGTK